MERKIKLLNLLERWKSLEEEATLQKLLNAQAELKALISQRKELEKELTELIKEIETKKTITAKELIAKIYSKEQVKALIKNCQKRERQKSEEIEKIRKELETVHKKKRLYETLKNRLYNLYEAEKYKLFLKELDDLAIMRKAREAK